MSVGSYIEIFMTLFGWHLYNIVWDAIVGTGLVYLPIAAAILDNVIKPMESQEQKSAAATSLRRLEFDVVRIMIMIFLAMTPLITLNFGAISQNVACSTETNNGSGDNSYSQNLLAPVKSKGAPKVPVLFYLVISVSGGINELIISEIPCDTFTNNIRELRDAVENTKITDLETRAQTRRFKAECYIPSFAKMVANNETPASIYAEGDTEWIGSHYLLANKYQTELAKAGVPGFTFGNNAGDYQYKGEGQIAPEYGIPSCSQWWSTEDVGLRSKLLKEAPTEGIPTSMWLDETEEQDDFIRKLVSNSGLIPVSSDTQTFDTSSFSSTIRSAVEFIKGGGRGMVIGMAADFLLQPLLYLTIQAAPYIQATILFAIYFLLPIVILIGNFEWDTVRTGIVIIFGVKFWTSIWAVVNFLDNRFSQIILDSSGASLFSTDTVLVTVISDFVVLALYTSLPVFFMSMLAWAGEKAGKTTSEATGNLSGGLSGLKD